MKTLSDDAFTRRKDYYAYGHVDKYSFGGSRFGSVSLEIFKKFAIMHFAADIRAAHQLPPLNLPPVTDVHPSFSIEFLEPIAYLLTSKTSPIPKTSTTFSPAALLSLSYLMARQARTCSPWSSNRPGPDMLRCTSRADIPLSRR